MEIKVYDFDKTIYAGDSSIDFFIFSFKKHPVAVTRIIPFFVLQVILYFFKKIEKENLKEAYFSFLKYVSNTDELIEEFWKENKGKLKSWYLEKEHGSDVIISASPQFLLEPIASSIGILKLIASVIDVRTGKFLSKNCYGKEKVERLNREIVNYRILECYSDSETDIYLFNLSQNAYFVKGDRIIRYLNTDI